MMIYDIALCGISLCEPLLITFSFPCPMLFLSMPSPKMLEQQKGTATVLPVSLVTAFLTSSSWREVGVQKGNERVVRNQYAVIKKVGEKGKDAKDCRINIGPYSSQTAINAIRRKEVKEQWLGYHRAHYSVLFFLDTPCWSQRGCTLCCTSQIC